jgi:hypothetical protein
MDYTEERGILRFRYNGVAVAKYHKILDFSVGDILRVCSNRDHSIECCDERHLYPTPIGRFEWMTELHKSLAAGNYIIEGELLTKCLELYQLLVDLQERLHDNVYSREITKSGIYNYYNSGKVYIGENNEIVFNGATYKVSDEFKEKALLSDDHDIRVALLTEETEIWLNAFSSKVKSARNRGNE